MGGLPNVIGRLAPGATFDHARTELISIAQQIETEHPSYSRNWRVDVAALLDATVKDVRAKLPQWSRCIADAFASDEGEDRD
ncbi:MAG: hypothetical protein DMF84_23895 [Acidobacteria bacterium]|nr:MAG: hypothetical protein DMF84_23895 [Acidobacteriota bacterium]